MNEQDIRSIHKGPYKLVFVSSGGGTKAISDLLKVPGASQTILESYIPYSRKSMDEYLKIQPSYYCGLQTTINMAVTAFDRAKKLAPEYDPKYLLGVAVTATLSTTYEKLGTHRFFICIQGYDATHVVSHYLTKGKRTRDSEEKVVSECLKRLIGIVSGLDLKLPELAQELSYEIVSAKQEWHDLESGHIDYVTKSGSPTKLIFPGTFQPFHKGHSSIQKIAEEKIGESATFEISISNVEKTLLSYYEIEKTLGQFKGDQNWVLTNAPTFVEKAEIFKESTFVMGMDTLIRLFDPKFYENDQVMRSSLNVFIENNIRFLIFGRQIGSQFMTLNDFLIPKEFKDRFIGITEQEFREDISSSAIKIEEEENRVPA